MNSGDRREPCRRGHGAVALSTEDIALADPGGASPSRSSSRVLGAGAVVLALLSATVTFLVLTGLRRSRRRIVSSSRSSSIDLCASLLLVGLIGREIWQIFSARRRGRAGARLHVRIILLFSLIAAAPAVLLAFVASITLDRGLAPWFSTRIQGGDRELAHRLANLFQRACVAHPQRARRDGGRRRPGQAAVRQRSRALPSVPDGAGDACAASR